jgi:preprotein translocase SecF subunit
MHWAPLAVVLTVASIIVGVSVLIYRGRDNYGIDFASGISMQLQLKGLSVKTSDVKADPDGKKSRLTMNFFDPKDANPVPVTRELVEEGLTRLSRLKDKDRLLDPKAVTVAWDNKVQRSPSVALVVAEPEGGVAAATALAKLIETRSKDVFRLRMDIKDVRRMITNAGYPGADVQTAFQDQAVVGLRESDQFSIRVRGNSAADTQEEREAVPTNIEQAFSDFVDQRGVSTELSVLPSDNATQSQNVRMMLRFVDISQADNTTSPMGLRKDHIDASLKKLGLTGLAVDWPKAERKYYDEITFAAPAADKDKITKVLTAKDAFTFPAAFTGYYFVNPGQARKIIWQAWVASLVSFVAILIYVWLRFGAFKYGLAAVASLVHDVLFTLGMLALAAWLSESAYGEKLGIGDVRLSLSVVAGILTLIGYSINDTIVVFDRIRENVRHRVRELRGRRSTEAILTSEVIDQAINQTLSRTILTSVITWIASMTLYIAGGVSLHGLSLCLIFGIMTGTYSSIAIASPILLIGHWWKVRRARARGETVIEEDELELERDKTNQRV